MSEKLPNKSKAMKLPLFSQREEEDDAALLKQRTQERVKSVLKQTTNSRISKDTKLRRDELDTITILQLADIHIDPLYSEVGSCFLPSDEL